VFLLACSAVATAGEDRARDTVARFVRLLCFSPAPHGAFVGVAIALLSELLIARAIDPGLEERRRGASIRYADHSVGGIAPPGLLA
jgi:hypothetical protein